MTTTDVLTTEKKGLLLEKIFVSKEEIQSKIELMKDNLTHITNEGLFVELTEKDGTVTIVDDKSWTIWNWPQGVGLYGIYKHYRLTGSQSSLKIVTDWFEERMIEGAPPKNVNTMAPLLTMALLYEDTKDTRYLPYLEAWTNWVMYDMPRTNDNGLQHETYGPSNEQQLWDDTLMMTVLPLAKIGMLLNRQDFVEEAKHQFLIHIKYLMDKKTGLWYHGWTFEGNHNYAEALWARGNCWITIAIPEIIDILNLQKGDAFYEFLVTTLHAQIHALAELQDKETGMWHTLLNDSSSYVESSATAGFAYGILKSVHHGYVGKEYKQCAYDAMNALLGQINEKGEVLNVSIGTGMGQDLDFYKNIKLSAMAYGQSLTVLAFSELLKAYC